MEALRARHGGSSSKSNLDDSPQRSSSSSCSTRHNSNNKQSHRLPPPNSLDYLQAGHVNRVRSFPHVEGNYALHVFIPVYIPPAARKEIALFLKRVTSLVPALNFVDVDIPLYVLCEDDQNLEQVALGREFHISLGRTVPIRVHQIDSIVAMLRQKFQSQRRYWIDFSKWAVFVNDERTRSFLSVEVITGGLAEITRQIHAVDEIYRLHNLPEFYKDPRPHVSLAWALGDVSQSIKRVFEELNRSNNSGKFSQKRIFTCKFSGIKCKIGNRTYKICKIPED
ncbi:U6 snRNA phosphodiesterase-like isoform X2 [Macadamia integrifolia]|uniref:U6 snRNA phosphodiesterase-like isoform X2 n=1 Tax=Macadamia integrifolia TaxID=60698 RepID=UPI001C5004A7|nr:U6 snRNA phosphodiesterase-like isoform X2 [Macadamia integrifolia]